MNQEDTPDPGVFELRRGLVRDENGQVGEHGLRVALQDDQYALVRNSELPEDPEELRAALVALARCRTLTDISRFAQQYETSVMLERRQIGIARGRGSNRDLAG